MEKRGKGLEVRPGRVARGLVACPDEAARREIQIAALGLYVSHREQLRDHFRKRAISRKVKLKGVSQNMSRFMKEDRFVDQ
jgi:hypothetical protein